MRPAGNAAAGYPAGQCVSGGQEPMQEPARPDFRVSILAVVLFQVAALFARSMLDLSLQRNGMARDVASDLSYLVVPPILLLLMFPYLHRCRDALRQLFARHRLTLRVVLCSVALGLTLRLMWWASTTFLIGIGVIRNEDPDAITGPIIGWECPSFPIVALSILVMAAVAPVTEEIVHRGFILYRMLTYGRNLAIIASAALFALMHESYSATFVAGLVFAAQALNYRALWGPIVAHATYNAAAVLDWDCFRFIWNPALSDPALSILTWASVPVLLVGAGLIILLVGKKAAGAARPPRPKHSGATAPSRLVR